MLLLMWDLRFYVHVFFASLEKEEREGRGIYQTSNSHSQYCSITIEF